MTYSDFINRELILFSNMDNERSIPALMDGEQLFPLRFVFQNIDASISVRDALMCIFV